VLEASFDRRPFRDPGSDSSNEIPNFEPVNRNILQSPCAVNILIDDADPSKFPNRRQDAAAIHGGGLAPR